MLFIEKVMLCDAAMTKLASTFVAAAYFELPLCDARMVHVPADAMYTVLPTTEHFPVVREVRVGRRPELTVAYGDASNSKELS
jgi:hypothetical protein